jgi:quercetin dioxygenase-like cupin family protein
MATAVQPGRVELSSAWIEGDPGARWRSASALGPSEGAEASGCAMLEVPAGCRLPRHTDSAEEIVVVTEGLAEITVGDETQRVPAGGVALVPCGVVHEVRNVGRTTLRFAAVYAANDVVTTYERPVRPEGRRQRRSVT